MRTSMVRPFILALVAAGFFGAATPLSKSLLNELTPFQLSGLLYLGAALGVLPLILRARTPLRMPWRLDSRNRGLLLGAIFFGGIVGPVLLLLGLRLAQAASVSLWLNMEAVATALLGVFFFRDHLGRNGWIGAGGILLASILLSVGEGMAGWTAGLLVAGAAVAWGFDNHLTALIDGISPEYSTLWKGLVAGSVNLGIGLSLASWNATPIQTGVAVLVGVFSYGLSIVLYIMAAQNLGATRSQLVFSTSPYFGIVLAVILLGEKITAMQIVAAVITGISIVLLTVEWHAHDHTHVGMEHEHMHEHDEHHMHVHAGVTPAGAHSHRHEHAPLVHGHRHWPDLHHRHEHGG